MQSIKRLREESSEVFLDNVPIQLTKLLKIFFTKKYIIFCKRAVRHCTIKFTGKKDYYFTNHL